MSKGVKNVLPVIPIRETYEGNELGTDYLKARDTFYKRGGVKKRRKTTFNKRSKKWRKKSRKIKKYTRK